MKHKIEKANKYYHSLYPNDVIFYKLPQGYIAFGVEVSKISSLLGVPLQSLYSHACIILPSSDFLDKTEILNLCGITYRAVSYFDEDGKLNIPDVDRLIEEQEIDY